MKRERLRIWAAIAALQVACAAGPASRPASAPASRSDAAPCLDAQGQRELLAGIALEAGEQAAQLARCNVRATGAERYAEQQQTRADEANTRTAWVSAIAAVLGAGVAAAITAGVNAAANAHHAQPAPQVAP